MLQNVVGNTRVKLIVCTRQRRSVENRRDSCCWIGHHFVAYVDSGYAAQRGEVRARLVLRSCADLEDFPVAGNVVGAQTVKPDCRISVPARLGVVNVKQDVDYATTCQVTLPAPRNAFGFCIWRSAYSSRNTCPVAAIEKRDRAVAIPAIASDRRNVSSRRTRESAASSAS